MEKQRVLLEELRRKLDLDLENFDKLTAEELKEIVDHAVGSVSEEIVDHAVGSVSAPTQKIKTPCLWKRGLGLSAFAESREATLWRFAHCLIRFDCASRSSCATGLKKNSYSEEGCDRQAQFPS